MTTSELDWADRGRPAAGGVAATGLAPPPAPRGDGHTPLGPARRAVRETGLAFITLGVMMLLFVAYQLVGTNFAEQHNQALLAQGFEHALAQSEGVPGPSVPPSATASLPGAPVSGAIAHMVIPKLGLDKYVVEGTDEASLQQGPGHYAGTVLPGQTGNSAIAGHRTTYGAPFFRLDQLAPGDPIQITNLAGEHFTYLVARSEVVDPSDVAVLANTPGVAELTLTTCNPRFSATSRLVVVARLTGTPLPAPVGTAQVGTGSPALSLGQGNESAWPAVIELGAVVLAGWILVRLLVNRTRRWRRVGAYTGGIAVLTVPLWFLFENVIRLLPPNI
ncbi:MAG: class E sortase [Acidimicrobiales bacterium]